MAVLVSDSFNRADSTTTLGSTDSYNGGTTKTWAVEFSGSRTWGISSNQAYQITTQNSRAFIDASVSDCIVKATISTFGDGVGITCRYNSDSDYMEAVATPTAYVLRRFNLDEGTVLMISYTVTPVNGDVISVKLNGSAIDLILNGATVGTATTTRGLTNTKHGIRSNGSSAKIDNFQVDSLTSGTAYTASLSDSITTSDTFSKNLTVTIVDTVTSSESTGKADSKAFSDTVSSVDSITANKGKALNLSDSIAIVDTISKVISRFQTDTVALSESKNDATYRGIIDSLTVSDVITISKGKAIILSDAITLSDSIGKSALLKRIETLLMADTLSHASALNVQLYDVMVMSETFSKQIPNAPEIIGRIELKGSRELYVYLIGSRELTVNLKGGLPVAEERQNISMYASESKIVGFTATDSGTSLPINLTGATIKWGMRRFNGKINDLYKDKVSGVTITDAAAGKFTVTFDPIDTAILSGDFEHQAEVTDALGKENIVAVGRVAISKNIFK